MGKPGFTPDPPEEQGFPCHWTHPHGRHTWTPLVEDPDNPRVLHLMGEEVVCLGLKEPDHEFEEIERCVYCKQRINFGWPTSGEWAHVSGSRYCQKNGFTATPLREATPTYHPKGGVL